MSITAICQDHRALEARAGQLLRVVASHVPDTAAVTAVRWGMAQALLAHCAHEERAVYAPLLASADAEALAVVRRFREQHGVLARRFAEYVAGWPIPRLAREWEAFRVETSVLMQDLLRRIADEEAELHPHFVRLAGLRTAA